MAKKKARASRKTLKTKSAAGVTSLPEDRYIRILESLLAAWHSDREGNHVSWDFGPGERPQKIMAEFAFVAKKEGIEVKLVKRAQHFRFFFPPVEEDEVRPVREVQVIQNGEVVESLILEE